MAKTRFAVPNGVNTTANPADPIAALIHAADKMMQFVDQLPCQHLGDNPNEPRLVRHERVKIHKRLLPDQMEARNALSDAAKAALPSLLQTGVVSYTEAESRVLMVVANCDEFRIWGWKSLGQMPPAEELDLMENWTSRQTEIWTERCAFFDTHEHACADVLRMWQAMQTTPKVPGNKSGHVPSTLEMIPGGFIYKGIPNTLTGKPRQLLVAIEKARFRRLSVADARKAMNIDDEVVEFPEEAAKQQAKLLRNALRKAVKAAGLSCLNPLTTLGRGAEAVLELKLP